MRRIRRPALRVFSSATKPEGILDRRMPADADTSDRAEPTATDATTRRRRPRRWIAGGRRSLRFGRVARIDGFSRSGDGEALSPIPAKLRTSSRCPPKRGRPSLRPIDPGDGRWSDEDLGPRASSDARGRSDRFNISPARTARAAEPGVRSSDRRRDRADRSARAEPLRRGSTRGDGRCS